MRCLYCSQMYRARRWNVVTRRWGAGNRGLLFNGYVFSVLQDEKSFRDFMQNYVYVLNTTTLYT